MKRGLDKAANFVPFFSGGGGGGREMEVGGKSTIVARIGPVLPA